MEQRTDSPYPRVDRPVLAARRRAAGRLARRSSCGSDREHDWRYYQVRVPQQVAEKFGADKAATRAARRAADLGAPTCGAPTAASPATRRRAWKGFESAEQPYRTHPLEPLQDASRSRRSAAPSCHGGQGWAVDTAAAHGEVAHWEEPLLSRVARRGLLARRRQERADADELQHLPPLRPRDEGRRRDQPRQAAGPGEGLPRLPRDQRPRRHDRPRPHARRREGARAVRLQPPVGPAHRVRLARRALQGSTRARRPTRSCRTSTSRTEQAQALAMLVLSWRRADVPARYVAGAPRTRSADAEEAAGRSSG